MPTELELMAHERMRWAYMSVEQLRTRVSRIRNPAKLRCFARMCEERSNNYLAGAAIVRAGQLGVLPLCPMSSGELVHGSENDDLMRQMDRALSYARVSLEGPSLVCPVCGLNVKERGECEFCKRAKQRAEQKAEEEAEKKKRGGVRLIRFEGKFSLDK